MITVQNKSFGQFWITENGVTYIVGVGKAAEVLGCTVEEARRISVATVEAAR